MDNNRTFSPSSIKTISTVTPFKNHPRKPKDGSVDEEWTLDLSHPHDTKG